MPIRLGALPRAVAGALTPHVPYWRPLSTAGLRHRNL